MPTKRKKITQKSLLLKKQRLTDKWNETLILEERLLEKTLGLKKSLLEETLHDTLVDIWSLQTEYNRKLQYFINHYSSLASNENANENCEEVSAILTQRRQQLAYLIAINRLIIDETLPEHYNNKAIFNNFLAKKFSELASLIEKLTTHLQDSVSNEVLMTEMQIPEEHILYGIKQSLANTYNYIAVTTWNSKDTFSFTYIAAVLCNYHKQLFWLLKEKEHISMLHKEPTNNIEQAIKAVLNNIQQIFTVIELSHYVTEGNSLERAKNYLMTLQLNFANNNLTLSDIRILEKLMPSQQTVVKIDSGSTINKISFYQASMAAQCNLENYEPTSQLLTTAPNV
jgi:hypothetical protein